ncbi:hypothetical protein HPP92_014614 [Vanilla planifolia]|uniref:Bifunctional inhibitor/plant lipid transfer protein/seed storage helical domain-containing protein n=1 Tax=Vanilla planifolia TaxID=51239 RepID=A0A835QNM4_VANPL|nr:hypothetical protein HPP92_014614 [Vanilla planifolia]
MGFSTRKIDAVDIVVLLASAVALVWSSAAQETSLTCASKLIPCQQYLNSTKPSEECCRPLKDAIKNDLSCLCYIFHSPDILKAYKIDLNKAQQLPVHCGIIPASSGNLCNDGAPSPYGTIVPPGNPSASSNGNNGSNSSTRIGMSGLVVVLFCLLWPL